MLVKMVNKFLDFIGRIHISISGEFRHELLLKTARWSNNTSLIDVIKAIVTRIDEPDIGCPLNKGLYFYKDCLFLEIIISVHRSS